MHSVSAISLSASSALMPPRRSSRLSDGAQSSPQSASQQSTSLDKQRSRQISNNTFQIAASSSSATSLASGSSSGGGIRRERRLEDIASDDDDDGDDDSADASANFMTGVARPVITGNAKHAASIPMPRQPRATFHEEADDDGFIFSVADPSSSKIAQSATVPGAKGRPPRASLAQHNILAATSKRFDQQPEQSTAGPSRVPATPAEALVTPRRVSSGSVKAVRRVSLLRDGTAAYPHPTISDADLHRHCSSELETRDRLRHLMLWTLDRSLKSALSGFSGGSAARSALEAAIRSTLQGLLRGELQLEWPVALDRAQLPSNGDAKMARPHPRNEANRRTEVKLQKIIEVMEKENAAWQKTREELEVYELETMEMIRRATREGEEGMSTSPGTPAEEEVMQLVRRALALEAPWLHAAASGASTADVATVERVASMANDIYAAEHSEAAPSARPAKRRRTTIARGDHDDDFRASAQTPPARSQETSLQGTEADARWHDVEWMVDQARAYVHACAQLSRLSERYTTAISARGAQAIGELMGSAQTDDHLGVSADGAAGGRPSSSSGTSRVSQEGQQTLQRILSGIRRLEREGSWSPGTELEEGGDDGLAERHGRSTAQKRAHAGDVSDGDILRAFAGIRQ